jgi:hypothetical protein
MRTLLTAFLGLSLAACTVGGIGDDGDDGDDTVGDDGGDDAPPPPVPDIALSMAPDAPCAPTATGATCQGALDSEYTFTVSATASGGFSGPVAIAINGLPASWESEILPAATIDLPVDGSASAMITVRVPSYGDAGQIALSITATSSLRAATYDVATSILNEYTARVTGGCDLPGVGARQNEPGGVNNPLRLKLGATFKISNATDHNVTIHSDNGGAEFPHQPDPGMGPGGTYTVMPDDTTAVYEWYCHDPDSGQRSIMRLID